jgi:hypothetical protein
MKIYKTQEEVERDVKDRRLIIDDDVVFECDIDLPISIEAMDITAKDINAIDINAIDINAIDINAGNIIAGNIEAGNISYYAVCYAYGSIVCDSILGRHKNSKHFCLDGKITIRGT